MSQQSIFSWMASFLFHGLLVFLALELMTHVTPAPSSKPLQWNVSLMNPPPAPHTPQTRETVKHVTPTHRAAISRPQPKRQVAQHRRHTQQAAIQPFVHRAKQQHITAKAYTPQRSVPPPMEQTTAKHTPLRQVTHDTQQTFPAKTRQDTNTKIIETTHNPVRFQNSTQQQTTVVATPSRLHAQVRTTSTKSVAQPVNTSSPVERSLDKHSASISRPQRQQLQAAIYTGTPQGQPARRVAPQSKPVSKSTRKVAQTKSSRNPRVASQKLSPEVLAFLKLLREKIQRHRKYPRVAKRLGYHGVTTVAFSLSQGGDLTLLKVSEPSGHDILDQAALNAIKKVLPLKPPSMMGNTAIEIPVSFELQR